jgi:hypothetical protein
VIIAAAGPLNGHIRDLYTKLEPQTDWVLCTGSLGAWPDKSKINKASKKHGGAGDFPEMYFKQEAVPIRTIFVKGPHEDSRWLSDRKNRGGLDILPNLTFLMTGFRTVIDQDIRIVGLGGVYSPKYFNSRKSGKYYTKKNIEVASAGGGTDVLLTHAGPTDPGIRTLIHTTRPKLFIHATHLRSKVYEVLGVPTIALAKGETVRAEYKDHRFLIL